MSRSRTAWLAAGLFLLALTLRWLYLAEIRALANYLILDSRFYYLWAEDLLAGHWIGDRVFDQSPLYAYLLAAPSPSRT